MSAILNDTSGGHGGETTADERVVARSLLTAATRDPSGAITPADTSPSGRTS